MDWLLSAMVWLTESVIKTTCSYVLCPLVKLYAWYMFYSICLLLIRILLKLRYETYNEDLKYPKEECKNKVLLITGATSGIGLAATKYLHPKGFTIVACYYSKLETGYRELEDVTNSQANDSKTLYLIELDVRSQKSIEACQQKVRALLDANDELRFHALINCAGVAFMSRFQWQARETIQRTLETNLSGPLMMTREFLPLMIANSSHCRLVNVSSPLGSVAVPYNAVYGATKAALTHFTDIMRIDAMRYNLKTVTILPGNVIRNTAILNSSYALNRSEILETLSEEEIKLYKSELNEHEVVRSVLERVRNRPINLNIDLKAALSKNLMRMLLITSGVIRNQKLEESHLMNSFDNAVRSRDPPKVMFGGNQYFEIITGAIFEMICLGFMREWSYYLAKFKINALG